MGEVTELEAFEKDGMELLLAFYQLIDGNGVVLEGRIRVWNAKVRSSFPWRLSCVACVASKLTRTLLPPQTGHPVWRSPDEFRFSCVKFHSFIRDTAVPVPRPPDVVPVTTEIPERFVQIREPGGSFISTFFWGESVWKHSDQVRGHVWCGVRARAMWLA